MTFSLGPEGQVLGLERGQSIRADSWPSQWNVCPKEESSPWRTRGALQPSSLHSTSAPRRSKAPSQTEIQDWPHICSDPEQTPAPPTSRTESETEKTSSHSGHRV
uniref:Uncharacterized protein n=1 Tax=Knipowitschia caucasica TaxID=637954 RepID=A0AAV2JB10_KNICA